MGVDRGHLQIAFDDLVRRIVLYLSCILEFPHINSDPLSRRYGRIALSPTAKN